MKIVLAVTFFLFLCFIDRIKGQSDVDHENGALIEDSDSWSRRIVPMRRKKGPGQTGASEGDVVREEGSEGQQEIGDSRRRPRPFAAVLRSNAETRYRERHSSATERENFPSEAKGFFDYLIASPEPSPILLPPFATSGPAYQDDDFYRLPKNVTANWWGESTQKSAEKTTRLSGIKIYEIVSQNSTIERHESTPSIFQSKDDEPISERNAQNLTNPWSDFSREMETVNKTQIGFFYEDPSNPSSDFTDERNSFESVRQPETNHPTLFDYNSHSIENEENAFVPSNPRPIENERTLFDYNSHPIENPTNSLDIIAEQPIKKPKNAFDINAQSIESQKKVFDINKQSAGNEKNETMKILKISEKNSIPKNPRGRKRYKDDFSSEREFGSRTFHDVDNYEWGNRNEQRRNYYGSNDESDPRVGSVPGIPGRDYPIHQEHTHHRLRNVANRFPCPRVPNSHIYLPDRASRCQIFYVCYGTKTGVPMVCPNGTLFNESLQVCDWWYNVSC